MQCTICGSLERVYRNLGPDENHLEMYTVCGDMLAKPVARGFDRFDFPKTGRETFLLYKNRKEDVLVVAVVILATDDL